MSSINEILSPYTERKVCEAQGRIEEEVSSIANANGITLDEEAPFVLGQWVHGESSNLNYLTSILSDLRTMKEKSKWFESATDVWSKKFFVPSPVEQFHTESRTGGLLFRTLFVLAAFGLTSPFFYY
ncbi:hypothetical protein P3S67_009234 [Capsicum chacoense]